MNHPTIDDRLFLLLKEQAGRPDIEAGLGDSGGHYAWRGFWKRMEELTGVTSGRWRNFFSGHQKAATDMIGGAAEVWPQYAFWLTTGITDAANGHVAPTTALVFPERLYAEDEQTNAYFQQSLKLRKLLFEQTNVDPADEELRRSAFERIRVLGKWTGGKAVDVAYALSETADYRLLQETWRARELERPNHLGRITGERRPWATNEGHMKSVRRTREEFRDERTKHQDDWDLFFKPHPESGGD